MVYMVAIGGFILALASAAAGLKIASTGFRDVSNAIAREVGTKPASSTLLIGKVVGVIACTMLFFVGGIAFILGSLFIIIQLLPSS